MWWDGFFKADGFVVRPLLAQAAQQTNPLMTMLPTLAMIMVVFYFLMVMPERQRQKEMKKLMDGLKKDDRVLTSSGIFGIVANIHRESGRITLKIDESSGAKMQVSAASIERVLAEESPSGGS